MNPYTHLAAAVASLLLGFYVGNGLATGKCDAEKLDAANAYASQLDMARKNEHEWQQKYNQGVQDARIREKQIAESTAASRASVVSLRHTVSSLQQRLSESSAEACRHTAGTLAAVFSECATRYGEVAAAADGHASDAALCLAAWPE